MELSDIEKKRKTLDQQYDGFFNFVEKERIGKYRIVHRESKTWLGIIDEFDNIVLPLMYDRLGSKGAYIESAVEIDDDVLIGAIGIDGTNILLPAKYKYIGMINNGNMISCFDGKRWMLVSLKNVAYNLLPSCFVPFDDDNGVCVLHKWDNNSYRIECWDENGNNSQKRLRMLALNSACHSRIKMMNKYLKLVVFSDIYGQVLYANKDLKTIFFTKLNFNSL